MSASLCGVEGGRSRLEAEGGCCQAPVPPAVPPEANGCSTQSCNPGFEVGPLLGEIHFFGGETPAISRGQPHLSAQPMGLRRSQKRMQKRVSAVLGAKPSASFPAALLGVPGRTCPGALQGSPGDSWRRECSRGEATAVLRCLPPGAVQLFYHPFIKHCASHVIIWISAALALLSLPLTLHFLCAASFFISLAFLLFPISPSVPFCSLQKLPRCFCPTGLCPCRCQQDQEVPVLPLYSHSMWAGEGMLPAACPERANAAEGQWKIECGEN